VRHARDADPSGAYVRRWVPELSHLPQKHIHAPWNAPRDFLGRAATAYPQRIIEDTDAARASFVQRVCHCRSIAPPSAFSKDGCDLISLPRTSGIAGPGIRALTERCFRQSDHKMSAQAQTSQGEGRGGKGRSSKGSGKGKGKSVPTPRETAGNSYPQRGPWQANSSASAADLTKDAPRQVYIERQPERRNRWRPRTSPSED
jgi:hypothetical protein